MGVSVEKSRRDLAYERYKLALDELAKKVQLGTDGQEVRDGIMLASYNGFISATVDLLLAGLDEYKEAAEKARASDKEDRDSARRDRDSGALDRRNQKISRWVTVALTIAIASAAAVNALRKPAPVVIPAPIVNVAAAPAPVVNVTVPPVLPRSAGTPRAAGISPRINRRPKRSRIAPPGAP
jgi:hypothetical protein